MKVSNQLPKKKLRINMIYILYDVKKQLLNIFSIETETYTYVEVLEINSWIIVYKLNNTKYVYMR